MAEAAVERRWVLREQWGRWEGGLGGGGTPGAAVTKKRRAGRLGVGTVVVGVM